MNIQYIRQISHELAVREQQVTAVAELFSGGATVPFIARYRKEATGSLDEVAVTAIRDRMIQLVELDKRRLTVLESIDKQGKLSQELRQKIEAALTLTELEDLYLPYKPKRRTRGTVAREKGLEPLAARIFSQDPECVPDREALAYVDSEKDIGTVALVLSSARDIMAEWINEHAEARAVVRQLYLEKGHFQTRVIKGQETAGAKFKDYFEWTEAVASAPSHRVLAARRGEKEGVLLLRIQVPEDAAIDILKGYFVKPLQSGCRCELELAITDGFKRLMAPSLENEVRLLTKERADADAIKTFQTNLRQLLMAPVLGAKVVMAVDPGQRTGCKVAVLDQQGKFLEYHAVFIGQGDARDHEAANIIRSFCRKYAVEVIAIGNGTASRETEGFIRALKMPGIHIAVVSESGASYYSASEVARREFPDLDLTVRGAVSIGRRLQDPLAELVKLDPKNIGVGQYQHDVDQGQLKQALDDVTVSCVNLVGVNVNTASRELLMYVSGLGPALAQAVVDYRSQNGPFMSRHAILNVPRFSAKAYEQAAGFLRIRDGENILDGSAVHPESYHVVEAFARDLGCSVADLVANEKFRKRVELARYVNERIGMPTLRDIMNELAKPGRDPRQQFEFVSFREDVHSLEDLKIDMCLTGVVTNITDFGVFVDIGVHHDGLVHISELSDRFVRHPSDAVKLHQAVMVRVKEVDLNRRRVALSMKGLKG